MKKTILLFLMFTFFLIPVNKIYAGEFKPVVAILYNQNIAANKSVRDNVKIMITGNAQAKLVRNYDVIVDHKYYEKLSDIGFNDAISADKNDITPIFAKDSIDYVIILDASNFATNVDIYSPQYIYFLRMKIIDIKNNTYLFNGKFTKEVEYKNTKEHMTSLNADMEKVLSTVFLK